MPLPGISHRPKVQQEVDPNKLVHIQLTETETMTFIDIPSICVSNESVDEATLVKANNAKYKEVFHVQILSLHSHCNIYQLFFLEYFNKSLKLLEQIMIITFQEECKRLAMP